MSDLMRHAPRLRCPSCDGFVNLAAGVVDLETGDRRVSCWECGGTVTWSEDTIAITPPGNLALL